MVYPKGGVSELKTKTNKQNDNNNGKATNTRLRRTDNNSRKGSGAKGVVPLVDRSK